MRRVWSRGSASAAAVVVALCGAFCGSASAAPPVFDSAHNCLRKAVATDYPVRASSADFAIHALSADAGQAKSDLAFYKSHHVWKTFADGMHVHPPAPLQIYEVPDGNIPGLVGLYGAKVFCGTSKAKKALLLRDNTDGGDFRGAVLAHELFHAFQFTNGDYPATSMWVEATAEWSATLFVDPEIPFTHDPEEDQAFLGKPTDPLDKDTPQERKYGAARFVMSLQQQLGLTKLWSLMRDSFTAGADTYDNGLLPFLRTALTGLGTSLPQAEATFWADHMGPLPGTKPQAGESTTTIAGSSGAAPLNFPVTHDSAKLVHLVPGASAPKKITIAIPAAGADTRFLIKVGSGAAVSTADETTLVFCLTGSEPDAQPWPIEGVDVGLSDGTPSAIQQNALITISSTNDDCDGPDAHPTTLPVGCPAPPPNIDLGGYPYRSFSGRFLRVQLDWVYWLSIATMKYGTLATAKPGRFTPLIRCAAKRGDAITDSAPDPLSASYVHAWAARMRASATRLDAGDVNGYIDAGGQAAESGASLLAYTEKEDAAQDGLVPP